MYDATTPEWQFNVYKMIGGQRVNRQWTWDPTNDAIGTNGVPMTVNGSAVVVSTASTTWNAVATELNIAAADKGTFVKWGNGAADCEAVTAGTKIAADAKAEFGYYSVTLPTTGAAVVDVTYTITNSGAVSYAKKGATFTLEITLSGTASGTTAKTFTVANGSMVNAASVTPASGSAGTATAAIAGGNAFTFTPVNAEAYTAVYQITVTVTGAGNVTFS